MEATASWPRVKEVFQAALERGPETRGAFLAEACAGDLGLRREVESLLLAHDEAGGFLEIPPPPPTASLSSLVGQRLGPYRVLAEIGRGGMGTVYRAVREDDAFRKEVAVKLVRGGDAQGLGARFRREREILARLQHPNIAALYDGGTSAEGQPYLAMELVEGQPLDAYCETRGLGVRERLRLFRDVCAAVQYAHQNLVVHRDLKPGNILVTAEGVPKLLDFGIAKLLAPEAGPDGAPTATMLPVLTPEYASPEQVRAQPVTTASDVYSLGVVLYELLAGHRPYAVTSRAGQDIVRVVCEVEPERPSTVLRRGTKVPADHRQLLGDLDTIVLKCLQKDAARRYVSAQELSEDLRRHLEGLPVLARPDTWRYRAGKFVRRHRLGVAAALVAALGLLSGTAVAWRQARIAEANRQRAERRFAELRQLANILIFDVHDAVKDLPGSMAAREVIVTRALAYLDGLARESGNDVGLRRELAVAYERVGDVQGRPSYPNLGDTRGALDSYAKALAIRQALADAQPLEPSRQRDVAIVHQRVGAARNVGGDATGALASYERALDIVRRLAEDEPADRARRRDLFAAHIRVASGLTRLGRHQGSLGHLRSALALAEATLAEGRVPQAQRDLGTALQMTGDALARVGEPAAALAHFERMHAIDQALLARSPESLQARRDLAVGHYAIGRMHLALGHLDAALERERRALELMEALARADPQDAGAQADVSEMVATWGDALAASGRTREARAAYLRATALDEARAAADPANQDAQADRANRQAQLGDLLLTAGQAAAAERHYRAALPTAESLASRDPANAEHRLLLARLYAGLGGASVPACAEDWHRKAVAAWAILDGMGVSPRWEAPRRQAAVDGLARCEGRR